LRTPRRFGQPARYAEIVAAMACQLLRGEHK
jgi:hypothetical protein